MATSPPRPPDPSQHYAAQVLLAHSLGQMVQKLFGLLDPLHLHSSLGRYTDAALPVVQQFARASRGLASAAYTTERQAAGVSGAFRPPLVDLPDRAQVEASIRWATNDLWSTDGGGLTTLDDVLKAKTALPEALVKPVVDTGRAQMIESVRLDRDATAWAREVEPGACWFCAMLASRGAVYRSQESGNFRTHDHCRCQAVPVFGKYEPTAQVREWQGLWADSTHDVNGSKGKQQAFQEAFEGRTIKRRGETAGHASKEPARKRGFEDMTLDEIDTQLRVVTGLPASDWRTTYLAKLNARRAELS